MSHDGRWLATGAATDPSRSGTSRAGGDFPIVRGEGRGVFGVAFSPDDSLLLSALSDNTMISWSLDPQDWLTTTLEPLWKKLAQRDAAPAYLLRDRWLSGATRQWRWVKGPGEGGAFPPRSLREAGRLAIPPCDLRAGMSRDRRGGSSAQGSPTLRRSQEANYIRRSCGPTPLAIRCRRAPCCAWGTDPFVSRRDAGPDGDFQRRGSCAATRTGLDVDGYRTRRGRGPCLRIWDTGTGRVTQEIAATFPTETRPPLLFTPDSKCLVCQRNGQVVVVYVSTGRPVHQWPASF